MGTFKCSNGLAKKLEAYDNIRSTYAKKDILVRSTVTLPQCQLQIYLLRPAARGASAQAYTSGAYTGSNRIAGEHVYMYILFKEKGISLRTRSHVTLCDDITQSGVTLLAIVPVTNEGRTFEIEFINLPEAREGCPEMTIDRLGSDKNLQQMHRIPHKHSVKYLLF
ncbi:hypothetical protein CEXT_713411 [Caerostris extrusa]|uniref:Uncharacterized protein n=1 Tax=Caerostris extrusa TaxID=172846 RepID=A0AAV4SF39_CAEEX|nr:hypothetical protein CEXT_713411 [Caerostris extrusa]